MLALVLAVASLVSTGAAVTCYNLAGDVADNNTPCNPDADDSLCCAPYDICLSNNLCYYTEGNELSRGVSPNTLERCVSALAGSLTFFRRLVQTELSAQMRARLFWQTAATKVSVIAGV